MRVRRPTLDGVLHQEAQTWTRERAGISHLTAGLGIEGRAIEDHLAFLPAMQLIDGAASLEQGDHSALRFETLVALEGRARIHCRAAAHVDPELARLLRAAALLLHRRVESRLVDGEAALARDVGSQVRRKAVGVVKLEDGLARNDRACALLC